MKRITKKIELSPRPKGRTVAVILAGGKGTRLRPLTYAVPKPLLPFQQRPLLEHIILHLKRHGIRDFIFTVGYLGYQIRNYFGDGSEWGVNIEYAEEKRPRGSAGCLIPLRKNLDKTFLLVGGDNLTTMNYRRFLRYHKKKGGIATLALTEIEVPVELGIADINKSNAITRFREKPVFRYNAATIIWALEPRILKYIPRGFSEMNKEILPRLLRAGEKVYGYPFKDFWVDIGRLEEYYRLGAEKRIIFGTIVPRINSKIRKKSK